MHFCCGGKQAIAQSRICVDAHLRLGGSTAFQRKRAARVFVTGWKPRERERESLSAPVAETIPMATAVQKITLSSSRDIPFNELVLSQSNVRRVKAGVSIEELAEDIARRTLLQGLNVRPVLDADGVETGMFEVPAGGRRYRALQLLVKQKRLAKTAPVPCVVRDASVDISAEEDSLAENVQRAPLHPLDQFRAFQALRQKGQSEEDIAAAFFVGANVVKQRLRLAAVSEKLLDVYAEDGMSLEQLMAFTVTTDHARQEQVWETLQRSCGQEPYQIRRMLTERTVRASDKRALFVGLDAYEQAGGIVMRDLFQQDDGGWLENVARLDSLVAEKLKAEAEKIAAEGWKWIEVNVGFSVRPHPSSARTRRDTNRPHGRGAGDDRCLACRARQTRSRIRERRRTARRGGRAPRRNRDGARRVRRSAR
jgi:ParB family transcriptional regulator, chromosome partitioning protein